MTTIDVQVPSDIADNVAAIGTMYSSVLGQVDTLTKQNAALQAQVTADATAKTVEDAALAGAEATDDSLTAQIQALEAQLAVSPKGLAQPLLGLAAGASPSYLAAWNGRIATLGWVPVLRTYEDTIPTSFSVTHAAKELASVTPPTHIIQSLIVSETATWASQVPALTTYLTSLQAAITAAAGKLVVRLCPRHEPEQLTKNIDPVKYGKMVTNFVTLCAKICPDVIPVEIYMCYTAQTRTPGQNAWLAAGDPRTEVLWDGYSTVGEGSPSVAAKFAGSVNLCLKLFPGKRQGCAEHGTDLSGPLAAQWLTDAYISFAAWAFTVDCYWDEAVTNENYNLDADPARVKAFQALPRGVAA